MLDIHNTVLLVIDFQGKLADVMFDRERIMRNASSMIQAAHLLNIPIILTEQVPDKIGATQPAIKKLLPGLQPIVKTTFSCCGAAEFKEQLILFQKKQVIITGIEAHVCVHQTVSDLLQDHYEVHILEDAISSRTAENCDIALKRMAQKGARISSTEMAICELLRDSNHDKFRDVMKLIK